jgi:flagellar basal-body rod modification protein FlgD
MTTPISSPSASLLPTAPAASTTAAVDRTKMDKDTFLKLLVAQLKYQDPMNPAEGTEFMAQTAQMTVVEKLDELTKTNAELLSANRALSASSLIGRSVVYDDVASGGPVTATVTGVRLEASGPGAHHRHHDRRTGSGQGGAPGRHLSRPGPPRPTRTAPCRSPAHLEAPPRTSPRPADLRTSLPEGSPPCSVPCTPASPDCAPTRR